MREEKYGEVLIQPNVRVPMRDGVELVTDVYLPAENGSAVDHELPAFLKRLIHRFRGSGCPLHQGVDPLRPARPLLGAHPLHKFPGIACDRVQIL